MTDLFRYLENNAYPGRGIFIGSQDNKRVIAYFIMGRSANSRNRVFRKKEDVLYTEAYDAATVADPSLIIYNAIRACDSCIIVSNGNQTDTIYDYLREGKTYEEALATRTYEPDAPNHTPRISALLKEDEYILSILKKKEEECERIFYPHPFRNGIGHFLSTYDHDGNPLPSFSSEPLECGIDLPFERFASRLWDALNKENKISLYVSFGDREKIFNRNEGD